LFVVVVVVVVVVVSLFLGSSKFNVSENLHDQRSLVHKNKPSYYASDWLLNRSDIGDH